MSDTEIPHEPAYDSICGEVCDICANTGFDYLGRICRHKEEGKHV